MFQAPQPAAPAPQQQAPAPAPAPQQTGSFMDMFNPGRPAPAFPDPSGQPAATPPAAPAAPAPAPTSPLDVYSQVFKIDPAAPANQQDAMGSPLFTMDAAAFEQAVAGMSFAPQVDAVLMQRIQQGDPAALQQVMNQTTQQAFMQAVSFAQKLVERGVGTYNQRLQGSMPDTFRNLATKNELQTLAPASQHEAARPLLDAMQQNFMRANPTATPAQVAQAMQTYLHTLGQQFAPAQPPAPTDFRTGQPVNAGTQPQNWGDFFAQ